MIEVTHLTKSYGRKKALDDVTFTVKEGEILGFLGPNGAGKSTTMNILTGYLSSTQGKVTIAGKNILDEPMEAKRHIGYLPEQPPLYVDMSVYDYLSFAFDLKKIKLKKEGHIDDICKLVKIDDVKDRIIRNLSKGYKQRVGLAQALLGNPDILILDEPTVGLDPKQIIDIRNLIRSLGKKHTIILSSHILPEVQAVCDRIIVISGGKLVADDTPEHLSHSMSSEHHLIVRIEGPKDQVHSALKALPDLRTIQVSGEKEPNTYEYDIEANQGRDVRKALLHLLAEQGWNLVSLRTSELSLEDVFLQLTKEDGNAPSPVNKVITAKPLSEEDALFADFAKADVDEKQAASTVEADEVADAAENSETEEGEK